MDRLFCKKSVNGAGDVYDVVFCLISGIEKGLRAMNLNSVDRHLTTFFLLNFSLSILNHQ
jgi:hypothetical protein